MIQTVFLWAGTLIIWIPTQIPVTQIYAILRSQIYSSHWLISNSTVHSLQLFWCLYSRYACVQLILFSQSIFVSFFSLFDIYFLIFCPLICSHIIAWNGLPVFNRFRCFWYGSCVMSEQLNKACLFTKTVCCQITFIYRLHNDHIDRVFCSPHFVLHI